MATCSTQSLLTAGAVYGGVAPGAAEAVELALLCSILQALDPMATCDIDTLLTDGACFGCVTNDPFEIVKLQLLCEISAAAGGFGGATCGANAPVDDPGTSCGLYYTTGTNPGVWVWRDGASAWAEIIAPGP